MSAWAWLFASVPVEIFHNNAVFGIKHFFSGGPTTGSGHAVMTLFPFVLVFLAFLAAFALVRFLSCDRRYGAAARKTAPRTARNGSVSESLFPDLLFSAWDFLGTRRSERGVDLIVSGFRVSESPELPQPLMFAGLASAQVVVHPGCSPTGQVQGPFVPGFPSRRLNRLPGFRSTAVFRCGRAFLAYCHAFPLLDTMLTIPLAHRRPVFW